MDVKKQLPVDPDLAAVHQALKRSAKAALVQARQTKTPCYIVEDGRIVDIAARKSSRKPTPSK